MSQGARDAVHPNGAKLNNFVQIAGKSSCFQIEDNESLWERGSSKGGGLYFYVCDGYTRGGGRLRDDGNRGPQRSKSISRL